MTFEPDWQNGFKVKGPFSRGSHRWDTQFEQDVAEGNLDE
jgi:hypothetical protein